VLAILSQQNAYQENGMHLTAAGDVDRMLKDLAVWLPLPI